MVKAEKGAQIEAARINQPVIRWLMKLKNVAKQRPTYFEVIPVAAIARLPGIRMRKSNTTAAPRKRTRNR